MNADDFFNAQYAWTNARWEFEEQLDKLFGLDEPGDSHFEDFTCDPVDWDGRSLELTECTDGWEPTPSQLEEVWKLGFDVIRIDYKTPLNRSHGLSGDFHRHRLHGERCAHSEGAKGVKG